MSCTVTIPVQVAEFPLWSVTETVTVLAPRFAQVNAVCVAVNETMLQLSVGNPAGGPARTTVPAPFKYTVGFWQLKLGGLISRTVIVEEQLEVFP